MSYKCDQADLLHPGSVAGASRRPIMLGGESYFEIKCGGTKGDLLGNVVITVYPTEINRRFWLKSARNLTLNSNHDVFNAEARSLDDAPRFGPTQACI